MLTIGAYSRPFAPRTGQKVSQTYFSRNEGIPEGEMDLVRHLEDRGDHAENRRALI